MSLRPILIAAAIGLLMFCLGFLLGIGSAPRAMRAQHVSNVPSIDRPGQNFAQVADYFAKLNPPPPPPPPPPRPPVPPPPPKPDVSVLFRQQVRALVRQNGEWVILVEGGGYKRSLKLGDKFGDGWVISALSSQRVELRHGKAVRLINLFERPPMSISEMP